MNPMMAGPAPQGMPPKAAPNPVEKNLSPFNPNDLAAMKGSGRFTPDMTVRDYFGQLGVDVDGPVTQLVQLAQKGMENASPLGKMKNISADMQGSAGARPPAQPNLGPPASGGLEGLIGRLGK